MTPSALRPALIVNVASRSGAAAFETARDTLTAYGVDLGRCLAVPPSGVRTAVKEAVAHGHRTLVVGGGDGTLSSVAGLLADLPAEVRPVLGVLPLGTANDFARTLGIPSRLQGACAVVAGGKVVDVDLGRAGGAPFLNAASVGLTAAVTSALRPGMKKRLGVLAYPLATLNAYRRHVPFGARLTFPGGDRAPVELSDLLQVTVGNGRYYGGGNVIAPGAGIDDHLLDVYAIRNGRLRDQAGIARRLRSGAFVEHDQVLHVTTRAVEITTDDVHPITLDGEPVGATPALFEVEANAVDVIVPQDVTHVRYDAGMPAAERGTPAP